MDAQQLRAIQTPIKERFRAEPETAVGVLTAVGQVDFDRLTVSMIRERPFPEKLGLHPMTGGDGAAGCAAELLLEALVGCAGVTLAAVCTAMEIPISDAKLRAEGRLDFRGTLGVNREVPVGFESVVLHFDLQSADSDEKLNKAVQLAERYCVVAQSVNSVQVSWNRIE
ncbi:MAG: OsmC family protein [Planctomycetaceae bacterium]|nr:OsmC family protein [Planctomycetaceae bacterium]